MKTKLNKKRRYLAYVLNKEFDYSQKDIAKLMKVTQSTISNVIKHISYEKVIYDLNTELAEARAELAKQLPSPKPIVIEI
jgi:predicted transcriptional regulator